MKHSIRTALIGITAATAMTASLPAPSDAAVVVAGASVSCAEGSRVSSLADNVGYWFAVSSTSKQFVVSGRLRDICTDGENARIYMQTVAGNGALGVRRLVSETGTTTTFNTGWLTVGSTIHSIRLQACRTTARQSNQACGPVHAINVP